MGIIRTGRDVADDAVCLAKKNSNRIFDLEERVERLEKELKSTKDLVGALSDISLVKQYLSTYLLKIEGNRDVPPVEGTFYDDGLEMACKEILDRIDKLTKI